MISQQITSQEYAHFRIMSILQETPDLTQRELAAQLGMSLGSLNYCLNALIDKGFVKMQNFQNSKNKFKYAYLLTPQGIAEKVTLTSRFLQRKMEEYEALKAEIEALKAEVDEDNKGIALGNDRFAEQIATPTGKPLASGKTGRPVG